MVLQINPYQPYQVKMGLPLSFQQIQCLTQLYQPIIGAKAISLYMTLAHQPQEKLKWTYRMMHSRLLPVLNMGIQDFNQARIHLEAVNLIRTYRDEASHEDYSRQTIYYEIQMPLSLEHFFKHPQLSLALYNQIGDEAYYGLLRLWKKEDLGQMDLSEISLPFAEVIKAKNQNFRLSELEEATEGIQLQDQYASFEPDEEIFQKQFDLAFFYQVLASKQIEKQDLSQAILLQVVSLSQFYGLDEEAMAQVVKLAQNPITHQIELELLKTYAAKHQYFKARQMNNQPMKEDSLSLTNEELADLKNKLQSQYTSFTAQEIEILLICEQMNPTAFLNQIKEEAGGFATSSEHYYLNELMDNSRLSRSTLNFLVYYLIVMEGHANFEKGRSNRLANEWQQEGLTSPAQALDFLYQQKLFKAKQNEIKDKKASQSSKKIGFNNKIKQEELVPAWLKDRQAQNEHSNLMKKFPQGEDPTKSPLENGKSNSSDQIKEEEIRKQLQKLLKKGDD
ncbi:DnaD domain protein [Facklamia miroungae]|uniref:Replicative DNA helicase loader DnaB n=1 Tax=Facklamia miroungae TaxID=120956 RepID=A0A1G7TLL5_9LACT|nr:DnaD domain protein [Facklamia miroungae]NKZ29783.1 hypothetical protein [Facklamia miroungae]SDG36218.1 replicative DNA helicase loader DnaB [Facklamia miroungae]